jgi:hypothetical protein
MTSIAVVAHTARRMEADVLAAEVGSDVVSIDDGTLGADGNHRRVWRWHADMHAADPTDWAVTLEDDALPVQGFCDQLDAALKVAPAPVVSLYLGTDGRDHWQSRIRHAYTRTSAATCWLVTAGTLLHAVAVAIRTDLLPTLDLDPGVPPDAAISNWCKRHGHPVAYSIPSLCDHADGPPVITRRGDPHPRDVPRHAHRVGTRTHWTGRAAILG